MGVGRSHVRLLLIPVVITLSRRRWNRHFFCKVSYKSARSSTNSFSLILPSLVSRIPSWLRKTHAGCEGISYSPKISAAVSSRLSKVKEWRSMNSRYEASVPFQATPTMRTFPLNFLLTSSTEGASRLQVVQPGAQNQKATGLSASAAVREKVVCVPIIFADTSRIDDGATVSEVEGSVV